MQFQIEFRSNSISVAPHTFLLDSINIYVYAAHNNSEREEKNDDIAVNGISQHIDAAHIWFTVFD